MREREIKKLIESLELDPSQKAALKSWLLNVWSRNLPLPKIEISSQSSTDCVIKISGDGTVQELRIYTQIQEL